jgi:hypothetical protein
VKLHIPIHSATDSVLIRAPVPDHLYPVHCTDLPSLSGFYEAFGIEKFCAGDKLVLNAREDRSKAEKRRQG